MPQETRANRETSRLRAPTADGDVAAPASSGVGANPPHGGAGSAAAEGSSDRPLLIFLSAVLGAVAILAGIDVVADLEEGTTAGHVLIEGALVLAGLSGVTASSLRIRRLSRRARGLSERADELAAHLEATRREAAEWKREAADLIAGLGAAIDRQLERWGLSPAEKEVALLLLKGLSHKEVAEVRGVGEATVRQQARAIYRKAGLSGRNDLAAFFLEDLLGPRPAPRPGAT